MTDAAPPKKLQPAGPAAEAERLIEASGRTQREVAAVLASRLSRDFNHYTVSRMISRQRKIAGDEMDVLRSLATTSPGSSSEVSISAAPVTLTATDKAVPLFSAGAGGRMQLSEEHLVGEAPIHPAQIGKRNAYAVVVPDDLLADRLCRGDIAYIVRNLPPAKGQPCLVEMVAGDVSLRIYNGQDEVTLFAGVLRPKPKDNLVALRDVAGVHRVVGSMFSGA